MSGRGAKAGLNSISPWKDAACSIGGLCKWEAIKSQSFGAVRVQTLFWTLSKREQMSNLRQPVELTNAQVALPPSRKEPVLWRKCQDAVPPGRIRLNLLDSIGVGNLSRRATMKNTPPNISRRK